MRDIIIRNLLRLLRSGAFNEYETLEPMSAYKWRKMIETANKHKLGNIVVAGIRNHQYDKYLHIPPSILTRSKESSHKHDEEEAPAIRLNTPFYNKKLQKIQQKERHEIDTSIETLDLLNIIAENTTYTLGHDIPLSGILKLGKMLRTNGHLIDFVKLERWLKTLHLQRMAQLQGSILVELFHFDPDEIPFLQQQEGQAKALALRTIKHGEIVVEWHFKQRKNGFLMNNTHAAATSIKRGLRYIGYAPIETLFHLIRHFTHSLSEIEE